MALTETQTDRQRPYITSTTQRYTVESTFTGVNDMEQQREKSYGTMNENTENLKYIPGPVAAVLSSMYCFITLCVLLIFPILEVAIGASFKDQCPIQPFIPIYLIVAGSCSMVAILLILIVTGTFIWCIAKEHIAGSVIALCCICCVLVFVSVMGVFLFAWFIAGNVWIFGAKKNVVYDSSDPKNYCQKNLYEFAFAMLIITYILPVLSCAVSCLRSCFGQKKG